MIFSVTNLTDFVDWFETIHKMWSCSFWTQPQKVVGYHRETHHFSEGKSAKEFTAPQHTRFILPPIHPDKIHRCAAWAVFFFCGKRTLKILWAVRTWYRLSSQRRCKTGAGTSFGATGDSHTWAESLYLFLRLNNSETFAESWFWAQR